MGRLMWWGLQCQGDHLLNDGAIQWFNTRWSALVIQKPSTPSAIKRACQRQTVVFDLPVVAIMALVPKPFAVRKMIWARQTCFCEV